MCEQNDLNMLPVGFKVSPDLRKKIEALRLRKSKEKGYHVTLQQFFIELLEELPNPK